MANNLVVLSIYCIYLLPLEAFELYGVDTMNFHKNFVGSQNLFETRKIFNEKFTF